MKLRAGDGDGVILVPWVRRFDPNVVGGIWVLRPRLNSVLKIIILLDIAASVVFDANMQIFEIVGSRAIHEMPVVRSRSVHDSEQDRRTLGSTLLLPSG